LSSNLSFGKTGENVAVDFLSRNGYQIIHRNFRVGRLGEIDIIAQENEYICFIEVKTRSNTSFGTPSESVTRKKQDVIKKVASIYLTRNNVYSSNVRFDVVEVYARRVLDGIKVKKINIIKNAF
jgi:putative endonuclease